MKTLALKCACDKCTAIMTITCPFNHKIGEYNTRGKKQSKFAIREDIEEKDILDPTKYGIPLHDCKRPHCRNIAACTKPDHIDRCTQISNHPTWNKRIIAKKLKQKRKVDKVTPAAKLVDQILAPLLPQCPLNTVG